LKTDEEKEIKYSVIQGRDSLRSLIKVKEELNDNMRSWKRTHKNLYKKA